MPKSHVKKIKIIIPENPNETQILVDGEDIVGKLNVKRIKVDVTPDNPTVVELHVAVDTVEIASSIVKVREDEISKVCRDSKEK